MEEVEQVHLCVAAAQNRAAALYTSLGFESFEREKHALKIDKEYVDQDYMVLWLDNGIQEK